MDATSSCFVRHALAGLWIGCIVEDATGKQKSNAQLGPRRYSSMLYVLVCDGSLLVASLVNCGKGY